MNNPVPHNLKKVISFILETLRPFKSHIFFMFLAAIICGIDFSFRKYLLKYILDMAAQYNENDSVVGSLLLPSGLYIFMSLSITTIYRIYGYLVDIKMSPLLRQRIADKAYTNLLSHDYTYYQENFTGDLVYKLNSLSDGVIDLTKIAIDRFFGCGVMLTLSIATLYFVNIKFAIATSIWVLVFITVAIFYFRILAQLANNYSDCSSKVTAKASDSFTNINSIKLFNKQIYERIKFFKLCKEKLLSERELHKAYWVIWFIYGYSFDFLQIISLYFLIYGFHAGTVTLGDFVLVIGINVAIVELLNQLTNDLTRFSDNYGRVLNSISTISYDSKIIDQSHARPLIVKSGRIQFEAVTFSYNSHNNLFDKLSVSINPQEKVGLVGFSGAGKSSFVNLMLRLFELKSGKIIIDGQSITDVRQDSIREQISVVPQDLTLFHESILENVRYGKIQATENEVIEAAKFAGIHRFITNLPDGYHTIVGEKGLKLSGGERQRINIARAFLKNAPILILDEATNQLDSITEREIQASLFKLMRNKTALVIAHRLSTLLYMDRILVFENGQIIQDGTHDELFSRSGLYQTLWNSQTSDIFNVN